MPRLALSHRFLDDYAKLEKRVQRGVRDTIQQFERLRPEELYGGKAVHLEKLQKAKDRRTRTIRINDYWRGVVMAPEHGDTYTLLKVMGHDEAIAWALKQVYSVNTATHGVEVRDVDAIEERTAAFAATRDETNPHLYARISDGEMRTLGVDDTVLRFARTLTRAEQIENAEGVLPEDQFEVLYYLAHDYSPDEVWRDVVSVRQPVAVTPDAPVPDLDAAVRATPSRIIVLDDAAELEEILTKPFAAWRVFLHPAQRRVAYRPSYSGPAQVTGGPGTGKTVVALHRVAHLLRHLRDGEKILLTSYTNALVNSLKENLAALVPDAGDRVDVSTVDAYARKTASRHGPVPQMVSGKAEDAVWEAVVDAAGLDRSVPFLRQEYRHVVLAQDLRDEAAYLAASRAGRGSPVPASQRAWLWRAFASFEERLRSAGQATWPQVCRTATDVLRDDGPEYRHVIVDEAQDLHPTQWRLLRAAVAERPDDLFIAGDPHQRIYDAKVSLKSLGIPVTGRTTAMRNNYRSTQEILTWSSALMRDARVAELADGAGPAAADLRSYRSSLHGDEPAWNGYATEEAQVAALVKRVRAWLDAGAAAEEIGIAVRFKRIGETVRSALLDAGIGAVGLDADGPGVRIGTMHSFKGLEFRCVAVYGADENALPYPKAVTPVDVDWMQHRTDVLAERCLLFVACTRAREGLWVSWSGAASRFLVEAGIGSHDESGKHVSGT